MDLKDRHGAITIDDESRQAVGFAEDEAARVEIHSPSPPPLHGEQDTAKHQGLVPILSPSTEDPRDYRRATVEERSAEKTALGIQEIHDPPIRSRIGDSLDVWGVDP